MNAIESGVGLQPRTDDDGMRVYDMYAVPQPDGTYEAHIVDNQHKVEFYSRNHASEDDAIRAAARWLNQYIFNSPGGGV